MSWLTKKLATVLAIPLLMTEASIEANFIIVSILEIPIVNTKIQICIAKAYLSFKYILFIYHLVHFKKN